MRRRIIYSAVIVICVILMICAIQVWDNKARDKINTLTVKIFEKNDNEPGIYKKQLMYISLAIQERWSFKTCEYNKVCYIDEYENAGYIEKDLNEDGIPELIIGQRFASGNGIKSQRIYQCYTIDDSGNIVSLLDSLSKYYFVYPNRFGMCSFGDESNSFSNVYVLKNGELVTDDDDLPDMNEEILEMNEIPMDFSGKEGLENVLIRINNALPIPKAQKGPWEDTVDSVTIVLIEWGKSTDLSVKEISDVTKEWVEKRPPSGQNNFIFDMGQVDKCYQDLINNGTVKQPLDSVEEVMNVVGLR